MSIKTVMPYESNIFISIIQHFTTMTSYSEQHPIRWRIFVTSQIQQQKIYFFATRGRVVALFALPLSVAGSNLGIELKTARSVGSNKELSLSEIQ